MERRQYLKRIGAAGVIASLAGCGGDSGNGNGGNGNGNGGNGNGNGGNGNGNGGNGNGGNGDSGNGNGGSGNGSGGNGDGNGDGGPAVTFGGDGEINMILSPSVPQQNLYLQYGPVRDHLRSYISENFDTPDPLAATMNVGSNYSTVIQTLGAGSADVAETGPFAAALGVKTDNVDVILQRFGFGSWTYKSIIATRNDSDIEEMADLEGKTVAFSDPLSTSGALYPLFSMSSEGGVNVGNLPEGNGSQADFEAVFAGGHVQSYTLLEQGQVDAAGMGGFVRDTPAGPAPEDFQEVATTLHEDSGLPRAPLVVSPDLPDASKEAVKEAFLEAPESIYLGADGEEDTEENTPDDDLWFSDVREASVEDYQGVIDVANELGVGTEIFQS